jgi:hypothetical protein
LSELLRQAEKCSSNKPSFSGRPAGAGTLEKRDEASKPKVKDASWAVPFSPGLKLGKQILRLVESQVRVNSACGNEFFNGAPA